MGGHRKRSLEPHWDRWQTGRKMTRGPEKDTHIDKKQDTQRGENERLEQEFLAAEKSILLN